jgi:hypothetical protein
MFHFVNLTSVDRFSYLRNIRTKCLFLNNERFVWHKMKFRTQKHSMSFGCTIFALKLIPLLINK